MQELTANPNVRWLYPDRKAAALDYHRFCVKDGLSIADAARAILGAGPETDTREEHLDRIEALRRYADTRT